ncbi:hypothetical protein TNCT_365101 [Trichonephila clavata]|uniref:Uncharacterized protein n=1 Tax=Trichonephila clavata TaxID=2740835 RepID=A0A8X6F5M0_TRICU|nr:hypothetical protein TNCT_365101 [Trichonephila clavata]
MFPHKIENNSKLNPMFCSRSNSCPNIFHCGSFVKEEAPKSISLKSLEFLKLKTFRFSLDKEEDTSGDDYFYSSSSDSSSDYERSDSEITDENFKETPFEATKNKHLQSAFHQPSSSAKSQEPSFCYDYIIKKHVPEYGHGIPEIKKMASKDDSSSGSGFKKNQEMVELSEKLDRSVRIGPPSEGPRSEWLPPIQTKQKESMYPIHSEQVLEPVFLPQQKSFLKWNPRRQSGTQVGVYQNLREQSNPRGASSYAVASSGREDIQRTLESIRNDYEMSFEERRRRCQTRYPRPQIIFRNQPQIGWRKRIRLFFGSIQRGVQNFFNR